MNGSGAVSVWACLGLLVFTAFGIGGGLPLRAQDGGPGSSAEADLAWGLENLDRGRYTEAAELFRKARSTAAKDSAVRVQATGQLVRTLRWLGKAEEALGLCDESLKQEPKLEELGCLKAQLLAEGGRYREAMALYEELLKANPKNYRAWALRKEVAVILGDRETVKKTTDFFFDLYQNNSDYYNSDAVKDPCELAYIGLGFQDENPKDAFEVGFLLAESLVKKRNTRQEEVFLWSARLAFQKYAFAKAAERYQEVLKFRPDHPDALTGLAEVWMTAQHDIKQAEPLLEKALRINPRHLGAHLVQALIQLTEDRMAEAKRHIDAALEVNPNHLDALAMLAFYHHDLKQPEQEAEVERRVLAINPKHADFYCSLGQLMEDKRGYNDATRYWKKAVEVDPQYWRGHFGLGMNTSRQGARGEEEGKRLLLKAFGMNRFNVWAHNMVRVLDKILGDEEQQVPPKYASSKTEHFTLKYYKEEAEVVRPYLEEWAEEAYRWQVQKFGFKPEGELSIEMMSTNDQSARTVGLPGLPALGVCFGKLCTVVTPSENKGREEKFNWRKTLEHEFGHVMTLQLSDYRVARWFTEGFSTYLEDDSRVKHDPMMVQAIAKSALQPIEGMNAYFRQNPLMAYVHGRYVIEYVDRSFGFETHIKTLRQFAQGRRLEEIWPELTGKPLAELNRGQWDFVRQTFQKVQLLPQFDQADLARLEGAARAEKASAQDLANLAQAHYATGKADLAEAGAGKAAALDPQCVDALNVLAALRYDKKEFEAAKKLYEQTTRLNPGRSFRAWQRLGVIFKKEGRTGKAIEALEQARQLYPRYQGAENPHYLLPELYADLEPPQPQSALKIWQDAARVNPDDEQAAEKGLKLACELKDWKAAKAFAERYFEIDPFEKKIHRKAGRVYEQLADHDRAAREYRVATVLDDKDAESWFDLARMEKLRNRREEALRAVQAALEIDGLHAGAKALRLELER